MTNIEEDPKRSRGRGEEKNSIIRLNATSNSRSQSPDYIYDDDQKFNKFIRENTI